jgi:hypothetical protein
MSYDLVVFDPAAPPGDRVGFLAWYADVARMGDGRSAQDPAACSAALQAWYGDIVKLFPAISGPDAYDNKNAAEYRFAPTAIFAGFQWEASRQALMRASMLARVHNVGFFDASGDTAAVWGPSDKGVYKLIHKSE